MKKELPLIFPKQYLCYVIYFTFISVLLNGFNNFHLGTLLSMILLAFYFESINYSSFIKVYRIVAGINIIIFFLQFLSIINITGVLQGLPISDAYYSSADVSYKLSVQRKSALFGEPAHFAQFLLPLIAFEVFNNYKKNWLRISIYILTILLLSSGNGYIGLGVIALFYFVKYPFKRTTSKVSTWLFSFGFICLLSYGFIQTELGAGIFERKEELNFNRGELSSGYIRIWRGYEIFSRLCPEAKIFGSSKRELTDAANQGEWYDFLGNPEYMNTFQSFLCVSGILGTIIFAFFNYELFRRNSDTGKTVVLLFTILSFMSSLYFSGIMLIYYVFSYVEKERYSNNLKT
ncbi:MAG: O-antigen ligase family protein [Bacteroidaceae bacterium]|nr:O-antigen ligase family protein [Bacteroidaceae bacterium]